jgi:hypothetical protein
MDVIIGIQRPSKHCDGAGGDGRLGSDWSGWADKATEVAVPKHKQSKPIKPSSILRVSITIGGQGLGGCCPLFSARDKSYHESMTANLGLTRRPRQIR